METESHSAVWTAGAAGAGVLPEKSGWGLGRLREDSRGEPRPPPAGSAGNTLSAPPAAACGPRPGARGAPCPLIR